MKAALACRLPRRAVFLILCAFQLILVRPVFCSEAGNRETTFKLKEVSVFEQGGDNFLRGQRGLCQNKPLTEVRAYPAFKSAKPIYGSVRFSNGESTPDSGQVFYFAADESRGTGKGYDLFYFDLNKDLDLGNDPVLKPQRGAPDRASLRYDTIKQQVLFEFLNLSFDCGPAGARKVQLLPRLTISVYGTEEYQELSFVRTSLYTGSVKIGTDEFGVELGNDYIVCGRLDAPSTAVLLSAKDGAHRSEINWWGGDRLRAVHRFGDKFYTLRASIAGDQLMVSPYEGALGTFELGAGGRKLDKLAMSGSLESKERSVAAGGKMQDGWPSQSGQCLLPEGDYLPTYLRIQFGRLQIAVSQNYHSEGEPRGRGNRPNVYGITIRKEKPFLFDFSNKPEVMFASPAAGKPVKTGDNVEVKAVLVDSKLDFMVRGLEDSTRKQTKTADGQPLHYERSLSLDPAVVITRLNGEKVAEGVMPFG